MHSTPLTNKDFLWGASLCPSFFKCPPAGVSRVIPFLKEPPFTCFLPILYVSQIEFDRQGEKDITWTEQFPLGCVHAFRVWASVDLLLETSFSILFRFLGCLNLAAPLGHNITMCL